MNAINSRHAEMVTGGDMAELLGLIDRDELYVNKVVVEKAMADRSTQVTRLIESMYLLLSENEYEMTKLTNPYLIPQC